MKAYSPASSVASSVMSANMESCTSTDASSVETTPVLKQFATNNNPTKDDKTLFVEALVESAVLIIETIWPMSFGTGSSSCASKKSMPLRRFIQETLKRSRTSYSTFQVALYYVILIKQSESEAPAALKQCGRRAFLTALILASKYLQDKNYSLTAWSKISGLSSSELCKNELEFLKLVDYNLHVDYEVYNRWSTLLLTSASQDAATWTRKVITIGKNVVEPELPHVLEEPVWDFVKFDDDDEEEVSVQKQQEGYTPLSPAVTEREFSSPAAKLKPSCASQLVDLSYLNTPALSDSESKKRSFDDDDDVDSDDEVCNINLNKRQCV